MFSKNINKGVLSTKEISEFIYDARYIILLYIVGDFLTTFHALSNGYGFEENGLLAGVMSGFGIWSLLIVKLMILLVIYWNYRSVRSSVHSYAKKLWEFSKIGISTLGLVLVVNNLMVIFVRLSLFEYLGLS